MPTRRDPDTARPAVTIFLLRAINVGGATLRMADLREWATELGALDVRTHVASGNLLCLPPGDPTRFAADLEDVIEARRGFRREIIVRTPDQVRRAAAAHPYEVLEPKFSYIGFLPAVPETAAIEKARGYPTGDDRWEIIDRELHLRFANGAGRPEMKTDSVLRALRLPCTMRNMSTVAALIDKSAS